MKFYYSPLSIFAILLIAWGIKITIAILQGAWATYFAFILPLLGIILLIIDFFIRKSNVSNKNKTILQVLIIGLLLIVGYLIFKK